MEAEKKVLRKSGESRDAPHQTKPNSSSSSTHSRRSSASSWSCSVDDTVLFSSCILVEMNNHYGDLHDEATVPGFEQPKSPNASYGNIYLGTEEHSKEPPLLPPQLQNTLLSNPVAADTEAPLAQPHNATINHLYIENRDAPRSVVALGVTHRFCSKFVTVVLYKPIQRRGN